jgi:hypothetical protein
MSVVMTRGLSSWHLVHRQFAEWMSCAHCVAPFHGDSYVCHIQSSVTLILYCCAGCCQVDRQTDRQTALSSLSLHPPFFFHFKLGTESHSTSKHSELCYSSFARGGNFIHTEMCPCLFSSLNNTLLNNVHYTIQRAWFVSHSQVVLIVNYFYARLHCYPETVCSYEAVLRCLWLCRHYRCLV